MAKPLDGKPFGKPDANDKNDKDISDVVDVGDLMPSFSFDNDPTSVRVIVGRKGTGKTHALRLLQVESRKSGNETLSRNIDFDLGHHRVVQSLFSLSGSGRTFADWERIWRCALAIAALSRFTCRQADENARDAMAQAGAEPDTIKRDWPGYCFETQIPLDPFGALLFVLDRQRNAEAVSHLANDPRLEELESFVSGLMRFCSPTHFFLDGFDEFEDKSPALWLQIQLGLFWLAFRANTTRQRLRRVHLTVAVRDGVLGAAQRSPHADRFDYGGNVMVLTWSREAATLFFRATLWRIRNTSFWRVSSRWAEGVPEVGWLGLSEIRVRGRRTEPLIDYIVRHSRCTPRDLISIGNAIASKFNLEHSASKSPATLISQAIAPTAQNIAELAIQAAAQELVRDPAFPTAGFSLSGEQILGDIMPWLESLLITIIDSCGEEIESIERFKNVVRNVIQDMGPEGDEDVLVGSVLSALWRNGVVAFRTNRRNHINWRYVWSDINRPDMQMPTDGAWVGLHPSMFEIARIARSARGPVF